MTQLQPENLTHSHFLFWGVQDHKCGSEYTIIPVNDSLTNQSFLYLTFKMFKIKWASTSFWSLSSSKNYKLFFDKNTSKFSETWNSHDHTENLSLHICPFWLWSLSQKLNFQLKKSCWVRQRGFCFRIFLFKAKCLLLPRFLQTHLL